MNQRRETLDSAGAVVPHETHGPRPRNVWANVEAMSRRRLLWWAFGLYAMLALFAYVPLWPGDPHAITNCICGDNIQAPWFLGYVPWAILHGHNPFFTTYLDFPRGVNLVTNTSVPLLGIIAAPVTELFGAVASYNLLMFLAFPLSGVSAAYVIAGWTKSNVAALAGGLFYAFSPYVAHRAYEHLNLMFVAVPPLIFYALYHVVVIQSGRARRWGVGLGLLVVAQCGIDTEIAVSTLLVGLVGVALCAIVARRELIPPRIAFARRALVTGAVLVVVVMAYPLAFQYLGPGGLRVPVQNPVLNPFRSDLLGLVVPTTNEQFAPSFLLHLSHRFPTGPLENSSYLGIFLVSLFIAVLVRFRRSSWMRLAGALAVFSWVMSLGPRLSVAGHVTSIPLPFDVVAHLPGVDNMLPARWSLFEMFFVAISVSYGLTLWRDQFIVARREDSPPATSRGVSRASATVLALVVLASLVLLVPEWPIPTLSTEGVVPAFFTSRAANVIPNGSTILTYPYVINDYRVDDGEYAMLWQIATNFRWRLMGGYSLRPGPRGTATSKPWLTPPYDVAAFLEYWQSPVHPPTSPSPVITSAMLRDVRVYLQRYEISTVVVSTSAPHASPVVGLFSAALGSPHLEGGADVWTGLLRSPK